MAASSYDEALKRLLVHEGGNDDDPRDPGGRTSRGIIQSEWTRWRAAHPERNLPSDVWQAPQAEVVAIYRQKYWDVLRGDDLSAGVDYCTFDYGVNSGVSRSAKVLQRLVGVDADGEIGDKTVAYARARDPKVLVGAVCDERLAFLKGLKTWPTFGKGWGRRVSEVRGGAMIMAGATQSVKPNIDVVLPALDAAPPWFLRQTALMGLYEFPGARDNPAILAMAKACGGQIAKTYIHDEIPWCALDQNYCLITSGQPGNDSLWALDFRKYGSKLEGPAVGAIATKTRAAGGHVFQVVGRDRDGLIVGRGGNQADMVCDEIFDPRVLQYNWPPNYPRPQKVGLDKLPLVSPAPKLHRDFAQLPPVTQMSPGKGEIAKPAVTSTIKNTGSGAGAGGVIAGATFWDWAAAHPYEAAAIGVVGATVIIGGGVYVMNRYRAWKQDAPTPGVVAVAA